VVKLSNSEEEEVSEIAETESVDEIRQAIVDSLRDIQYDILINDADEVEAKLAIAIKYLIAWRRKKLSIAIPKL